MAIEVGHQTTIDPLREVDRLRALTRAQLEQIAELAERGDVLVIGKRAFAATVANPGFVTQSRCRS